MAAPSNFLLPTAYFLLPTANRAFQPSTKHVFLVNRFSKLLREIRSVAIDLQDADHDHIHISPQEAADRLA